MLGERITLLVEPNWEQVFLEHAADMLLKLVIRCFAGGTKNISEAELRASLICQVYASGVSYQLYIMVPNTNRLTGSMTNRSTAQFCVSVYLKGSALTGHNILMDHVGWRIILSIVYLWTCMTEHIWSMWSSRLCRLNITFDEYAVFTQHLEFGCCLDIRPSTLRACDHM